MSATGSITIPRSFWPAKLREGGSEVLEEQLNEWVEARGNLAKEWAKARVDSTPDTQMQQLNLTGTEQKVGSNEEEMKSPALRLAEATNLVKIMQEDASKARCAAMIKEYLASQNAAHAANAEHADESNDPTIRERGYDEYCKHHVGEYTDGN